jgi:DNA polymerase-3 subunit chi
MTKVDFYILATDSVEQRYQFACRLIEKAFKKGHDVYIHSDDEQQANLLDQLLWSFRNHSFIPHQLTQNVSGHETIMIGHPNCPASPSSHHDVMINLSRQVPDFFSRFNRVSEIVVQCEDVTNSTRKNYRFYRDRGYPLESHKLAAQ